MEVVGKICNPSMQAAFSLSQIALVDVLNQMQILTAHIDGNTSTPLSLDHN